MGHMFASLSEVKLASWSTAITLVSAIFLFQILRLLVEAVYNVYFHPLRKMQGPWRWIAFPFLKSLAMVDGSIDFKIRAAHEKYGEVVRLNNNEVSFIVPEAWKDIYGHGHAELPKVYPVGIKMDPKKIIASDASNHFRFRRAMLPAFSDKALSQQEPLILVYVNLLMERFRQVADSGQPTNMVRWYTLTTFDLIGDLAYGESLQGLESGTSNRWIQNIENMMRLMPMLTLIGVSPMVSKIFQILAGPKIRNSMKNHKEYSTTLAMKRITREGQADRGDFMDYMMRSKGKAQELTDPELVANCDLFMVAGSETTATLLSGITYWLLRTPHALKRVTEEVRSAFEREEDITFKAASVKLPYMLACLDEALRVFPPIPLVLFRKTLPGPPTPIGGHQIPPNTHVGIHQLSAFHSEQNFHRPREFVPERWLPESTNNPSSPFYKDRRDAHRPFSFGPRDCIGRNLAYHEMRLIMAKVLWNFDLELDAQCHNWHEQKIYGLWEKPPLMVRLKNRA